ncbi:MAG TPA: c-type cytochrome [Thermodesulfobacteriota bacterium]|nr:c-type cytochrome [Thermodesulfobacteriota bacterium]
MRRVSMFLAVACVTLAFYGQALGIDAANIFMTKCSPCHGKDAKGTAMAPSLAGGEFIAKSDVAAIKDTIKNGRSGDQKKYKNFPLAMPKWDTQLKEDEIDAVAKYLKGLK